VIRLSYSATAADEDGHPDFTGGPERADLPDRPTMKCVACGERFSAGDIPSANGLKPGTELS
jgi:hypothetical protein